MKSYVQILGAGTPDGGGPAILIFFDDERYLLNCGEGLQRFCGEHRIKLGKLSHILLSRLDWDCVGGIPGLISTLADAGGCPSLQIVGPKNTQHFVAAMRPFLQRSSFAVGIEELSESKGTTYADQKLKIKVIELVPAKAPTTLLKKRKSEPEVDTEGVAVENLDLVSVSPGHFLLKMFKDPAKYGTPLSEEVLKNREHYRCVEHDRMTTASRLPSTSPSRSSLVWCIEGPEIPGKFLAQKAKKLGVPNGPLNGRLTKGETIELPDGRKITPDMCIGPLTPGPIFVYLDVPTMEHAEALISKKDELQSMLSRVTLVVHYCPKAVYNSSIYAQGKFVDWPSQVTHVHLSESQQAALESPSIIQSKLENSEIYRIPWCSKPENGFAKPLTKFHWISSAKVKDVFDESETRDFMSRIDSYVPSCNLPVVGKLLVSVFGTGAALPGKYRNVSSALLTFPQQSILLDCGEGTTGQILRCHGEVGFENIMKSIRTVFISHLHADHHAGLVGFLRRRILMGLDKNPLLIIAPQRYALWLEEYSECVPIGDYDFIACEDLVETLKPVVPGLSFQAIPVEHCPRSFGSLITCNDLKVIFSGDTRPCQRLVDAGMDSDLLIHEATMGDDLQAEAIDKRHSTISEAISIGKQMNAKHILLNHFSQRYSKTAPPLPNDSGNVSVAFDLMTVSIDQIHEIEGNQYNERIRELLPETEVDES